MLRLLLDVVLPVRCLGCGRPEGPLCASCAPRTEPVVVTPAERQAGAAPALCVAAGVYGGTLRAMVLAYKERGHRGLARPLGDLLADAVVVAMGARVRVGPVLLVPVPSSAAAVRARRDDHTLRLARSAARALRHRGLDAAVLAALTVRRAPADSVGLGAAERKANIAGAFGPSRLACRRRAGASVVLIDDVVTTGATLDEASRTATGAGLPVAAAAVVAATPSWTRRHRRW